MSNSNNTNHKGPLPKRYKALTELDQAVTENRFMAYRWLRTWSDPWVRRATWAVLALFAGYAVFVVYVDAIAR